MCILNITSTWLYLSYPASNAHAPHCHLWPAPLYITFSTLSH